MGAVKPKRQRKGRPLARSWRRYWEQEAKQSNLFEQSRARAVLALADYADRVSEALGDVVLAEAQAMADSARPVRRGRR